MKNAKTLLVALAIAGGCTSGDSMKRAEEQQADNRQEAVEQRTELAQEQQQEQQALNREVAEDQRDVAGDRNVAEERAEVRQDAIDERAKLNAEQARERQDLERDLNEQGAKDQKRLSEAEIKVEQKRSEIATDTRKELSKLDQRAAKIQSELSAGEADKGIAAASVLETVPKQRQAINADLEALDTVRAENLNRAKSNLSKRLSALDDTLDKAESKL